MVTWANPDTIQRPAGGLTIPSQWGDQVDDDLALLVGSLQIIGVRTARVGTPPALTSPGIKGQCSFETATTDTNGNVTITFPTVFPNGLVFCHAWPYYNGAEQSWVCNMGAGLPNTATTAHELFTLWNYNTNLKVANTFISFYWVAIGF